MLWAFALSELRGNGAEEDMHKILYVIGLAMLLLPISLRVIEGGKQKVSIATYIDEVEQVDESKAMRQWELAEEYNRTLYQEGRCDMGTYDTQLNLLGNGVMGSIEIPKIDLKLPIYHGTGEEALAAGVGHLKKSSLPVGGENTHSVLTGHRGMPKAQLFTRLDELEVGDMFYLQVCQKNLSYRVCEIQVVEPEDSKVIAIQKDKDLVSLVTCTPYGLNTHRLVVTGRRDGDEKALSHVDEGGTLSKWDEICLGLSCLFGVAICLKNRKRKGVSP